MSLISLQRRNTSSCSIGESPADGSSSSSSVGSSISARPIATIWRSPPDSDPARWSARSAQPREQPGDDLVALVEPLRREEAAHLQVLAHRQRLEHVLRLRHEPDAALDELVGRLAGDVVAVEADDAGAHGDEAEHGLEERRLAGAVGADDADELARGDGEVAAVEDVDLGHVAGDEVGGLDDVGGRRGVERSSGRLLGRPSPLVVRLGDLLDASSTPSSSASRPSSSIASASSIAPRSTSWWAPR